MEAPEVHRLFELLGRHIEAYAEATETFHLAPISSGSKAAQEIADYPDWPVRDAWTLPHLPLCIAEDHLRHIGAAARTPKLVFGTITSGRIALETSARAYWLLGDPDLDARRRVARYYAFRLSDLARNRTLAATLTHAFGPEVVREAQEQLDHVVAAAERFGFRVPVPKKGLRDPVEVAGEALPSPTKLAGIAMSERDTQWGERLYDRGSAILHGRPSGLFSVRSTEIPSLGTEEAGISLRAVHKSTTDVALAAAAPVLTHATAVQRMADATGNILDPAWHATRGQLVERLRGHLKAAEERARAGTP